MNDFPSLNPAAPSGEELVSHTIWKGGRGEISDGNSLERLVPSQVSKVTQSLPSSTVIGSCVFSGTD